MESTAFFDKKVSLTPSDLNEVKNTPLEVLLLHRAKTALEGKCSEQGFVLPGSIEMLSRSMGYFEAARFTGDANYYLKLKGQVIYPVEGMEITGKVIRKNKMGLYVNYKDAIRIQVPRDLHLDRPEFEEVRVGDEVEVMLKRSKFAIHDTFILASGMFIDNLTEHEEVASFESTSNVGSETNVETNVNSESDSESESDTESESESESNRESNISNISNIVSIAPTNITSSSNQLSNQSLPNDIDSNEIDSNNSNDEEKPLVPLRPLGVTLPPRL